MADQVRLDKVGDLITALTTEHVTAFMSADGESGHATVMKIIEAMLDYVGRPITLARPDPSWDASGGSFPASATAGNLYIVTVSGTVDGVSFAVNDQLLCLDDDASTSTYAGNWLKLDYTDQVLSVAGLTGAISRTALEAALTGLVSKSSVREVLTANRTYYVGPTGSDSNSGLTSGAALASIQAAYNKTKQIDANGYNVAIKLLDGTYPCYIDMNTPVLGTNRLEIIGNDAHPENVILNSGYRCFDLSNFMSLYVHGVTIQGSGAGSHLYVDSSSFLRFGAIRFGATARNSIEIDGGSAIMNTGTTVEVFDTAQFVVVRNNGVWACAGGTLLFTGTPAVNYVFRAANSSVVAIWNLTFTGDTIGRPYRIETNAVMSLGGGPTPESIPGNAAGEQITGGIINSDIAKVAIADVTGLQTALDSKAVEADLASTDEGKGAALVGVEDVAANFPGAETVEAALAALAASIKSLGGIGIVPQDMSASRTGSTAYSNDTGAPLDVVITGNRSTSSSISIELSSDGSTWGIVVGNLPGSGAPAQSNFVRVPPGWYYRVNGTMASGFVWVEYRAP